MTSVTLHVRAATQADVDDVDALLQRSYPRLLRDDYKPSVMVTALPIISRAQPKLVTCGTYYVVTESAGMIVGAGGWTPVRTDPSAGQVRHVVTDASRVRQGIGRLLMTHIMREALREGPSVLHCQSTLTAVPFYQAMGFAVIRPIDVPLRDGITFPAVLMHRRL